MVASFLTISENIFLKNVEIYLLALVSNDIVHGFIHISDKIAPQMQSDQSLKLDNNQSSQQFYLLEMFVNEKISFQTIFFWFELIFKDIKQTNVISKKKYSTACGSPTL